MNKKLLKATSFIILSLTLLTISNICFMNSNTIIEKEVKIQQRKETISPIEINETTINKIKILQALAVSYKEKTNTPLSTTELTMHYIRKDNTNIENYFLDELNHDFIQYVYNVKPDLLISDEKLIDPITKTEISLVELITKLNAYYTDNIQKEYINYIGNLMLLLEETITYIEATSTTNEKIISNYINSLLGTNNNSSFSINKTLESIDAINISKLQSLNIDLANTLTNYYIKNKDTNNSNKRFKSIQKHLGTKNKIKENTINLLNNQEMQNIFIPNTSSKLTPELINILATEFVDYIYEKPYIELEESTGIINVGEEKEINIIGKHLENIKIITNNKVATTYIDNNKLYIIPIEQGETTIKLQKENTTTNYKVIVNNIKPTINTELRITDELIEGISKTINFTTTGTNIKYNWYISSNKDKNYKKIYESNIPSFDLTPTKDMNNKYLICGIKNKGNEEIYTTPILLNITSNKQITIKDKTIIIAIMTIITVVLANILQLLIQKYKIQK